MIRAIKNFVRLRSKALEAQQEVCSSEDKNIRACIHARTARKRQVSDYVQQITDCSNYIEQKDWTLYGIFLDEGVSGRAIEKPELSFMMEMATKGSFDVLVVSNVDRLSRSAKEIVDVARGLQDFHVALQSVNEPTMTLLGLNELTQVFVKAQKRNTTA